MKRGVRLIKISKLRAHEQVCPKRLKQVIASIKRQGKINNPVVVDNKYKIILDGHHRSESLRRLGCRLVPVMLVDYFSENVRVFSRRKNIKISKQIVITRSLADRIFPQKSTRHFIVGRIRGVNIKLNRLK